MNTDFGKLRIIGVFKTIQPVKQKIMNQPLDYFDPPKACDKSACPNPSIIDKVMDVKQKN